MKNSISKKHKHLTSIDRAEIQDGLYRLKSFKEIAKSIDKDPSTVSKEIRLHSKTHTNSFVKNNDICPNLLKHPYVCNACRLKSSSACSYPRKIYNAKIAQQEYEENLVDSRTGIALNKPEFYENDRIISERVKNGQHIYHILHSSNVSVSKSTVYRYFKKGYLSASLMDLPRAVKFKERKCKDREYVPKGLKKDRTYQDFLTYMEENNLQEHKELDTLVGTVGGKLIMTIHFVSINFMFGLLLDNKTATEAAAKIRNLKDKLSNNDFSFGEICPVILTDNGVEFSDIAAFECDKHGNTETKLFFCDPMMSSQKPYIEKNHTLFRDIVPKSISFDHYTQETVNLIFSHVNSVKRDIFNGKSPYELFTYLYSEKLAELFGIRKIAADKVVQSPILQQSAEFKNTLLL